MRSAKEFFERSRKVMEEYGLPVCTTRIQGEVNSDNKLSKQDLQSRLQLIKDRFPSGYALIFCGVSSGKIGVMFPSGTDEDICTIIEGTAYEIVSKVIDGDKFKAMNSNVSNAFKITFPYNSGYMFILLDYGKAFDYNNLKVIWKA